jgi:hypothetical protein
MNEFNGESIGYYWEWYDIDGNLLEKEFHL